MLRVGVLSVLSCGVGVGGLVSDVAQAPAADACVKEDPDRFGVNVIRQVLHMARASQVSSGAWFVSTLVVCPHSNRAILYGE